MLGEFLTRVRYLSYLVGPEEASFETIEEIPNYVNEVIPLFIALVILEAVIVSVRLGKKAFRMNDAFGSISQGVVSELFKLWIQGMLVAGYVYVYSTWRLVSLPWNSTLTWAIGLLTVDFVYYWLHRASHEINLFWAAHQVHHSSEDYNLSTALRQSALQSFTHILFYVPLGLIVPPTVYLVHSQLNLLYQFWIHTEVVNKLGPLELILNTPSHHRVHHGRNRYCIDANYAGVLIIWDRIFGTFRAENEEVVYGLTHPLNSFDPAKTQFGHFVHIWKMLLETPGFTNKLSVLFKGPGWSPGKPRLGDPQDIPDVHAPVEKYDPKVLSFINYYILLHFSLVVLCHVEFMMRYEKNPYQLCVLMGVAIIFFSLTSISAILENRPCGPWLELSRCLILLLADYTTDMFEMGTLLKGARNDIVHLIFRSCFTLSAFAWVGFIFFKRNSLHITIKKAK